MDLMARLAGRALKTRALARAPIPLYRRGFGWLLGQRVLMLEHVGRKSKEARYVCLEVVDRPSKTSFVVASGFGTKAQWFRNLEADPACHVSVGRRRRVAAHARFLSPQEARETLGRYQQTHPIAWKQLRGVVEAATGEPVDDLPMVALDLESSAPPA